MEITDTKINLWEESSDPTVQRVREILSYSLSAGDIIFWKTLLEVHRTNLIQANSDKVENGRPTQD